MLLLKADARHIPLKDESVHCVVTSPPYWGLRDYGLEPQVWGGDPNCCHEWSKKKMDLEAYSGSNRWQHGICGDGRNGRGPNYQRQLRESGELAKGNVSQGAFCSCGAWCGCLGLEPTVELYVEHTVEVFREVRRVLRQDGTLWLNMGDSHASQGGKHTTTFKDDILGAGAATKVANLYKYQSRKAPVGLKPKDLVGMPWRVAFALQADGWYLRSDIIWHKPNPMPESVTDRPTKAHEYLFLLTKAKRYFYDYHAVMEPSSGTAHSRGNGVNPKAKMAGRNSRIYVDRDPAHINRAPSGWNTGSGSHDTLTGRYKPRQNESFSAAVKGIVSMRNKRTVWTIPTQPYSGSHFATFPEALVEPCILAGTSAAGCCAECGKPFARIVERGFTTHAATSASAYPAGSTANRLALVRQAARKCGAEYGQCPQTIGWEPCQHGTERKPCIVLDPFCGSGTTVMVAEQLGRIGIGMDLGYHDIAKKRLANIQKRLELTA